MARSTNSAIQARKRRILLHIWSCLSAGITRAQAAEWARGALGIPLSAAQHAVTSLIKSGDVRATLAVNLDGPLVALSNWAFIVLDVDIPGWGKSLGDEGDWVEELKKLIPDFLEIDEVVDAGDGEAKFPGALVLSKGWMSGGAGGHGIAKGDAFCVSIRYREIQDLTAFLKVLERINFVKRAKAIYRS